MSDTSMVFNMRFNADTAAAKKQIEDLNNSLNKLTTHNPNSAQDLPLTESLAKAQIKAQELKTILTDATNTKTGKLDLGKFSESLEKNKTSLGDYRKALMQLGPEGQSAFLKLSSAISQGELPLKRTSALMKDFSNTMKNTIKWQISSSMMHGFMSAISGAWNYAKDLNESLNDIRIVTGYNIDQMSAFADQANRAAKALSTTTTQYTDASLIYYQQGLTDKEVQSRTDTTIKLANVSKQSVTESADQMTTIWNNYAEGAENLEYYADVLVKLGAATASSSEEIATGISKFAATGKTVGLSYEYATAALATVTATTRESADTVGTAFKTLFARIQDLEQGKTLDDGTTLGQYAEALNKVGINIKTATGEVKDMDQILDETGEKWGTLSRDAQIALAENVAGVRQYTQFMALMNSWDFFKENVSIAKGSTGALEEQQEIYAESWEAASKRVQSSLENIYQNILDDEFFINLTNGAASFADNIGLIVKNMGGLQGTIAVLSPLLFKMFGQEISANIDNIVYRIQNMKNTVSNTVQKLKEENNEEKSTALKYNGDDSQYITSITLREQNSFEDELLKKSEKITEQKRKQFEAESRSLSIQAEAVTTESERLNILEKQKTELQEQASTTLEAMSSGSATVKTFRQQKDGQVSKEQQRFSYRDVEQVDRQIARREERATDIQTGVASTGNADSDRQEIARIEQDLQKLYAVKAKIMAQKIISTNDVKSADELVLKYDDLAKTAKSLKSARKGVGTIVTNEGNTQDIIKYVSELKKLPSTTEDARKALELLEQELQEAGDNADLVEKAIAKFDQTTQDASNGFANLDQQLEQLSAAFREAGQIDKANILDGMRNATDQATQQLANTESLFANFSTKIKAAFDSLQSAPEKMYSLGEGVNYVGTALTSLASLCTLVSSAWKTLNDEEATTGAKAIAVISTLGMAFSTLTRIVNQQTLDVIRSASSWVTFTAIKKLGVQVTSQNAAEATKEAVALMADSASAEAAAAAHTKLQLAKLGVIGAAIGLAAAVVGVAVALYKSATASDEASKRIKEQKEQINNLNSVLQEAQVETQSILDTLANYQEARDGLDELTEGTNEFRSQLFGANQELLSLIGLYPELKDYVSLGDNGLYTLNEEGFQYVEDQVAKQQTRQLQLSYLNNIANLGVEGEQEAADIIEHMQRGTVTTGSSFTDLAASYLSSEFEGAPVEVVYNLETGNYKATVEGIEGYYEISQSNENGIENAWTHFNYINPNDRDAWSKGFDMTTEQLASFEGDTQTVLWQDLDLTLGDIVKDFGVLLEQNKNGEFVASSPEGAEKYDDEALAVINANKDNILRYIDNSFSRQTQEDLYRSQAIQAGLSQVEGYSDWSSYQKKYIESNLNQEDIKSKATQLERNYTNNKELNPEQTAKDLLTELGYTNIDDLTIKDDKITATDAEGNTIVENMDFSTLIKQVSELLAIEEETKESAPQLTEQFEQKVKELEDKSITRELAEKIVSKSLDTNNLTGDEIEQLKNYQDEKGKNPYQEKAAIAEEQRREMINNASDNAIVQDTVQSFSKLSQLTGAEIQNLAAGLDEVFSQGGASAVEAYDTILENSDLSINELQNAFKDVDWNNIGVAELKTILEDAGVETDLLGDHLIHLIAAMKSTDIDSATAKFNSLKSALSLSKGDTIDASLYEELSVAGQSYFSRMADGTYQLISDADEFYSLVRGEAVSGFANAFTTEAKQYQGIQSMQNDGRFKEKLERSDFGLEGFDSDYLQGIVGLISQKDAESGSLFQEYLDTNDITPEHLQEIVDKYNELGFIQSDVQAGLSATGQAMSDNYSAALSAASSLSELNDYYGAFISMVASDSDFDIIIGESSIYNEQLISIGESSKTARTEANEYKKALEAEAKALAKGTDEEKAKAKQNSAEAKSALKAALANEELMDTVQAAAKAIKTAISTIKDLTSTYGKGAKELYEYQESIEDIAVELNKVFGSNDITEDFVAEHLDLIESMIGGDEAAFQTLQQLMRDNDIDIKVNVDDDVALQALEEAESYTYNLDGQEIKINLTGYSSLNELVNDVGATFLAITNDAQKTANIMSAILSEITGFNIAVTLDDTQNLTQGYNMFPDITYKSTDGYLTNSEGEQIPLYGKVPVVRYNKEPLDTDFPVFKVDATKDGYDKNPFSGTSAGKSSGGSGGGGGGGGGGSSKPAKKVQKTKFTDLGDRYHTITKQIDNQARATDKLAKLEDRLYGAAKIKAMQQQSAELKKQNELLVQKRKEAEAYLKEDTKEFEDQIANFNATYGTNFKAEYGKDGEILNYREIIEAVQEVKNAWEDQLNSYATQEEQDSDENQQYEEDLNNNVTALSDSLEQYEDTLSVLQEIEDTIEENTDAIRELNFGQWSEKLELYTNKLERFVNLAEHTNKLLGNSIDNVFTADKYLKSQGNVLDKSINGVLSKIVGTEGLGSILSGTWLEDPNAAWKKTSETYDPKNKDKTSLLGELTQLYKNGEINQAQYVEGMQALQDELYELGDSLVDIEEEVLSAFSSALSDAQDRIGFFADQIDDASSELEHYSNLLDLIGKEQDYKTKGAILSAQGDIKTSKLSAAENNMTMMEAQYKTILDKYNSYTDEQKEKYRETLESAYSAWIESQDNYLTACEEYAEAMRAIAENELNAVNKEVQEALLGKGRTWDAVNSQIDMYSSIGEEYLTNTNKIYEITKLTRDMQSQIDKTSNTAAQQKLATFKKQTEELGKQENLTEYELELQKKKYELLQAELALEEAKDAKSQVRLSRDSEGNYSYVYTADEGDLQSAEDEYLEKQNALYNYALEGSNDYYTKYVQTLQSYNEAMAELQMAYLTGEIETDEEYKRRKLELNEYYGKQLTTYTQLYNLSIEELNDKAVDSWTTSEGLIISTTEQMGSDLDSEFGSITANLDYHLSIVMNTFGNTVTGSLQKMGELKSGTDNEIQEIVSIWGKGEDAISDYQTAVTDAESPITKVLENITGKTKTAGDKAVTAAKQVSDLTTSLGEQLTEVEQIVSAWVDYYEVIELVKQTLADLQKQTNDVIDDEAGDPEDMPIDKQPEEAPKEEPTQEAPAEESAPELNTAVTANMVRDIYKKINYGEWQGTLGMPAREARAVREGYPKEAYSIAQDVINDVYSISNGGNGSFYNNVEGAIKHELEKAGYAYNTGGYTGDWGTDGRLALLHQKELVLNASDTENMLSMVSIVRDLVQTLDLNVLSSILGGMNSLTSNWGAINSEAQKLEQEVHIEANFPNATDKNEILEAFQGLSDLASQYANRK